MSDSRIRVSVSSREVGISDATHEESQSSHGYMTLLHETRVAKPLLNRLTWRKCGATTVMRASKDQGLQQTPFVHDREE